MSIIEAAARAQRVTDATSRYQQDNAAVRVTEVRSALTNQITNVEQLEDVVKRLAERLQPVLNVRPAPEQAKNSTAERIGLGAPVADEIDRNNRRIYGATQQLQDLLDWLEV